MPRASVGYQINECVKAHLIHIFMEDVCHRAKKNSFGRRVHYVDQIVREVPTFL